MSLTPLIKVTLQSNLTDIEGVGYSVGRQVAVEVREQGGGYDLQVVSYEDGEVPTIHHEQAISPHGVSQLLQSHVREVFEKGI